MNTIISFLKKLFSKKPKQIEIKEEPKPIPPPVVIPEPIPTLPTNIRIKDTKNDGNPVTPDWAYLWDNCIVDEKAKSKLDVAINKFIANRHEYSAVQGATGIADWFTAGLHLRECSMRFDGCLHNGDPWNKVTTHVPKGLGPWNSWHEAAIHALNYDHITYEKVNTIEKALEYAFRFNGVGYKKKIGDSGLVEYSPYVCAFTNWHDETSKYTGDGKYDPHAEEKQLGVMAFWKELENRGLIVVK